jgi:hypothetical protein
MFVPRGVYIPHPHWRKREWKVPLLVTFLIFGSLALCEWVSTLLP